jgi:ABC-type sugar transport system ATPase subunit
VDSLSQPAARKGAQLDRIAIELRSIHKRYGATHALRGVDLEIATGTVHALVGENGAGKSTLGKIIAGSVRRDEGEMLVDGRPADYRSPHDALVDGIAAIQQEISLVPDRTVLDNVFLGVELRRRGLPSRALMRKRYDELCSEIGFVVDPSARVADLRVAEQQKVEILRALARDARVIVMDEPTASLGADEVEALLTDILRLRDVGRTIIFVSHRLAEVKRISDRITVLRNGSLVKTWPAGEVEIAALIEAMLGRELDSLFPPIPPVPAGAKPVLRAERLSRGNAVRDVSLTVHAGEIVGIAGLVGSGRSELARLLFGADRPDSGTVVAAGEPVTFNSPVDAIRAGVGYVPEDRKGDGLVLGLSTGRNVALASLPALSRWGVPDHRRERDLVGGIVKSLDVRPPDPDRAVAGLSGGNQQKVMFGKWLLSKPRVLIVDEPTRGVDVGAKFAIYELIARLAAEGLALIVISSELPEVLGLAHRVCVMREGRLVAELSAEEATEDAVMRAAFGAEADTEVCV